MEFLSKEELLVKLEELKKEGFDTLHLPGGTSKGGNYYAGAIVVRYDFISRKVYFLGVPYNSYYHLHSSNGHSKKEHELPDLTVIRELLEETGIQAESEDLWLVREKKIQDNRPGREGEFHHKFYYLIVEFTGEIFTFNGPNPIDGETAAPLWIPSEIFVEKIFKGHLKAVRLAIEELSFMEKKYAYALMDAYALMSVGINK